jgi:hypothetical protein
MTNENESDLPTPPVAPRLFRRLARFPANGPAIDAYTSLRQLLRGDPTGLACRPFLLRLDDVPEWVSNHWQSGWSGLGRRSTSWLRLIAFWMQVGFR